MGNWLNTYRSASQREEFEASRHSHDLRIQQQKERAATEASSQHAYAYLMDKLHIALEIQRQSERQCAAIEERAKQMRQFNVEKPNDVDPKNQTNMFSFGYEIEWKHGYEWKSHTCHITKQTIECPEQTFGLVTKAQPDIKSFYHGVSESLLFPELRSHYNNTVPIRCPLSTSSCHQVAANFAHSNNGLIMQIGGGSERALSTYFSVDWLSDYPNEQEHLFIQDVGCLKYASSLLVNVLSITFHGINLLKKIIDTTSWDEVHVFSRMNPPSHDPSTLAMSKLNFMDGLNYFVDRKDMNIMQLIPIDMTSCLWIVHLFNAMDMGILFNVQNTNDITVTAMYLDADTIRNQVKTPQQYDCLDHFDPCVDDLVIIDVSKIELMHMRESQSMYSETDSELWSDYEEDEDGEVDEKIDYVNEDVLI
eukprot:887004_1